MNLENHKSEHFQHILKLTKDEKRKFLNSFDIILSDCDGVLWSMLGEIANAGVAVNLLKKAGKSYRFVSNNSLRSDEDYIKKLQDLGVININKNDIVHPVKTIIHHLHKKNMKQPVYTLADNNFNIALKQAGFEVINMSNVFYSNLADFATDLPIKEEVGAVIFDIDYNLTLAKLIKAQFYLKQPDCKLIVGASDSLMPLQEDLVILGPGSFINMLSDISGKAPIILGKPGDQLGDYLIENFNIKEPNRVLFIGDALVQDIHFGKSKGFQTLLVLSGATSQADVDHLSVDKKPDYYADGLIDFIDFFKDI